MKLLGAGCLWVSMFFLGITKALRLKKRTRILEKTQLVFQRMLIEIEYLGTAVPEIVRKLSCEEGFSEIDFLYHCCFLLENALDFPSAWIESIRKSDLPFEINERQKLMELSDILGKSDLSGQKQILNMYMDCFYEFACAANKKEKKYVSLYTACGAFVGCAVFIMLV